MNIFDITPACDPFEPGMRGRRARNDGPRDCTDRELRAYLNWLAERDGVAVPANAVYGPSGIAVAGQVILAMPGYGVPQVVTCEIVDDAGEVIRAFPLPADKSGKLPMTAKQVQEWSGIAPVRKSRKKPVVVSAPAAPKEESAPEPAHTPAPMPERAESAPEGEIADTIAALVARIEALEAAATPLSAQTIEPLPPIALAPDAPARPARTAAHARAIRLAWQHRRAARLARSIAEDQMRMREQVQATMGAIAAEHGALTGKLRHRTEQLASARTNMEKWAAEARKGRRSAARRKLAIERARRMVAAFRKDRDGARQALSVARAETAKARRDMADPTQPERASDLARLMAERDTARQACTALEQRAHRSEEALSRFADRFDATLSRALRAEAELRRLAA